MSSSEPSESAGRPRSRDQPELSIVLPCLDEAETLEICLEKAKRFLSASGTHGEIIVADNGSTDGSREIARRCGVRVVEVAERGYGHALRAGIEAARGEYVIMADADDSYDLLAIGPLLEKLREGHDLVMGNRFLGGIEPGAMPWKHRWIGNPILTAIGRLFFRSRAGDFHCGLRGLRRDAWPRMELQTGGMEFASEMVIKTTLAGLSIAEVPVVLSPDGRTRAPHLRPWRDGWRHLRFMLLFSPRWLFLIPGLMLSIAGGLISLALLRGPVPVGSVVFGIHTLLVAGLMCVLGYQLVIFAVFTKVFAVTEGFHPRPRHYEILQQLIALRVALPVGIVVCLLGLVYLGTAVLQWSAVGFGGLDPTVTMRRVIPSAVLLMLGAQTIYASFFMSILELRRG
jgi:hypothetical protein